MAIRRRLSGGERAADPLHCPWINPEPFGNDAHTGPPRGYQGLADSFFECRGNRGAPEAIVRQSLTDALLPTVTRSVAMADALTVNTGAEGNGSSMRICNARLNLRAVARFSAAFGLALTFVSLPAAAQQWTPKQRAACEPDAMRLCNQYIPDVQRVSACMSAYRRYLSPACRAVLYGGQRKKVRRR